MTNNFSPPIGLRNKHVQTILASVGPRKRIVRQSFAEFKSDEQIMILNCHDGIRLSGVYNQARPRGSQQLVVLIHGWEGCMDSLYMLSTAAKLLRSGVDVFRLNLRDHGGTQGLNKGIFNSTLIDEVISGLEDLQTRLDYQNYSLVGFSLGGNFALRVAALSHKKSIDLSKVIAFCPAIHAKTSNAVLNQARNFVYGQYFVHRWKNSLFKKLQYFPEYEFADALKKMKNLNEMNAQLIPKYTRFNDIDKYFEAYAITGDVLKDTICPCYIHFAKDDMIIPYADIQLLADNPDLDITLTEKGGHCGFLMNWKLESWQDQRILELVSRQS